MRPRVTILFRQYRYTDVDISRAFARPWADHIAFDVTMLVGILSVFCLLLAPAKAAWSIPESVFNTLVENPVLEQVTDHWLYMKTTLHPL